MGRPLLVVIPIFQSVRSFCVLVCVLIGSGGICSTCALKIAKVLPVGMRLCQYVYEGSYPKAFWKFSGLEDDLPVHGLPSLAIGTVPLVDENP